MHAVAALPYCDIFLTERSLTHLITAGNASLATLYDTKVTHNADEALQLLDAVL